MSKPPENPKFWEPFTLSGAQIVRSSRKLSKAGAAMLQTAKFMNGEDTPAAVVYPEFRVENGVEKLIGHDGFAFTHHIAKVTITNNLLLSDAGNGSWSHAFVWRDGKHVMTDMWSTKLDDDHYPQTTIRVFRGLDEVDPVAEGMGHVGAETMFAMGLEEQYRRRVIGMGGTVAQFLKRNREHMPEYPEGYIAYTRLRRQ